MSQVGFVHDDPTSASHGKKKRDQSSLLSAVAIADDASTVVQQWDSSASKTPLEWKSLWDDNVQPVLSSALLITGNTVGASCLVLPEVAARPGLAVSAILFAGAYVVNLISGLIIAEVAIEQHDSSGEDPPSSFKEFADANLSLPMAGTIISCISLFVNSCIMSFDLTRAGQILSNLISSGIAAASSVHVDSFVMSIAVGIVVAMLGMTQDAKNLSTIASMAVTALFVSFGGLLLPGLANVHESPLSVLSTPGTSTDVMSGISDAAPIILMTLVYQNIIPSVTKILNYDRHKVVTAMVLGSGLPLAMFLAWCYASIGGGIAGNAASGGPAALLLTAFSLAAVSGSSIGSVMSISSEIDSFLLSRKKLQKQQQQFETTPRRDDDDDNDDKKLVHHRFSVPSVLLAVATPLMAAYLFADGDDFTAALSVAGGYGTPLLYGAIPVAMAWTQRRRQTSSSSSRTTAASSSQRQFNLVPGGTVTLGGLGAGALAFMGQELIQDVNNALASSVM